LTDYDSPWKEALDRYFEPCIAFIFAQAHAEIDWGRRFEMLDKELQQIVPAAEQGRRYVDKLVKVWLKSGEERWLLIHIEVQTWKEGAFPKRMYVYNYRLFDRYDREVISLAILADDDPDWRPSQYGYGRWGFRTSTEFPVVKLLDYAPHWQALEANPNPFALVVLAHLKTLETRQNPADRQAWKVRLVKGLYDRGWGAEEVRQLFRFIDWVMDLPPALDQRSRTESCAVSPPNKDLRRMCERFHAPSDQLFWQEIRRYEEEKRMPFMTTPERLGRQWGLLEGIELGLKLKFGPEGLRLLQEIRQLADVELLRTVLRAIETAATPEDLRRTWAP
jgi:hypothetical protein